MTSVNNGNLKTLRVVRDKLLLFRSRWRLGEKNKRESGGGTKQVAVVGVVVVSVEDSFEKLVMKKKVTNVSHTTAVRKIIKIT